MVNSGNGIGREDDETGFNSDHGTDYGACEDDGIDESDKDSDPEVIRCMLWNDNAKSLFSRNETLN